MKNLLYLLVPMFMLFACNNTEKKAETEEGTEKKCEHSDEKKCEHSEKKCCQMTEEQKIMMESWENWDNLTSEERVELVAKRKECFDKKMAEKAEKCEGKKEECPEKAAKCAKMKETLDNWDNLTIEDQKAFFDAMAAECKEKCNKEKKEECKDKE